MNARLGGKRIILAYIVGVLAVLVIANTPISIPCIWRVITGIPCPACGFSRAAIYALRLDIVSAAQANILFWPFIIGAMVYFACAVADAFWGKHAIIKLNKILSRKWVIALAVCFTLVSWAYNMLPYITADTPLRL